MKLETKFDIDQEVYYMEDNSVKTTTVVKINIEVVRAIYVVDKVKIVYITSDSSKKNEFPESYIFEDKESLLNSL